MNKNLFEHKSSDVAEEYQGHLKRSGHYIPHTSKGLLFSWKLKEFRQWLWKNSKFLAKKNSEYITIWDVMQYITLPLVIVVTPIMFTIMSNKSQEKIEQDKYQQTALDNYIAEMSNMIVEQDIHGIGFNGEGRAEFIVTTENKGNNLILNLKRQSEGNYQKKDENSRDKQREELITIAKAKTLTTLLLLDLDSDRRNVLLNFLREDCFLGGRQSKDQCKSKKPEQEIKLLEGLKLEKVDLTDADLSFANLTKTELIQANLTGANLNEAVLANARLDKAQLCGSFFSKANLTDADLSDVYLPKDCENRLKKLNKELGPNSNFSEAKLKTAKFRNAQLPGANFEQAILIEADFIPRDIKGKKPTNLKYTSFRGTDLTEVKFNKADLTGADFSACINQNCKKKNTILKNAHFQEAILTEATFNGADLSGANFTGAKGTNDKTFEGAILCSTTMPDGKVNNLNCPYKQN